MEKSILQPADLRDPSTTCSSVRSRHRNRFLTFSETGSLFPQLERCFGKLPSPCLRLRLGPTTLAAAGLLRLAALRRRPPASACPRPRVPSVAAPASAPPRLRRPRPPPACCRSASPELPPLPWPSPPCSRPRRRAPATTGQPPRLTRPGPAAVAHTAGVLRRPSPLSAPP